MLKKEQILKVLKKYGFYSLNRAPYIYQNKSELGVYFVWPNIHYGNLERVLFFETEEELEDEVFKYYWFLSNKNKLELEVEFDNYEVLSPKVSYKYMNTVLSKEVMKSFFDNKNSFISEKDAVKKKQLQRTAQILIAILREKFKLQNETFFKVSELQENLKLLKNEYNKKLKKFNKSNEEVLESYELLMDENDDSETLANTLYDDLALLNDINEIRAFIETMFTYLSNVDSSDVHLHNVYLLNRYPFEIDDLKKKVKILDNSLKEKKKLFKPKKNVIELLQEVDNTSQCRQMININLYIEKEKKFIKEKYQNRGDIDENVLGDYLLNFEKINVEVPPMVESINTIDLINKDDLTKVVKSYYDKLTKKEKSACHVASSFLSECLNSLSEIENLDQIGINEVISNLILNKKIDQFNEAFQLLDNYLNAKLRVKYFSVLKINTFEVFIESLIEVLHILNNLSIIIENKFFGYYSIKEKEIININLKNLSYLNNKDSFIATIMPNVSLYYSPVHIVKPLDIVDNMELVLRENTMLFILKSKVTIDSNINKVNVIKYEKDKIVKKRDIIVVMNMKENKKCVYYEDIVKVNEGDIK